MNSPSSKRPCRFLIRRRSAVTLFLLAWSIAGGAQDQELLLNAVRRGDVIETKALLQRDPHLLSTRDKNGDTPLHVAELSGHEDMAKLLLANNAEVDAKDSHGWTPLHAAAANGCDSRRTRSWAEAQLRARCVHKELVQLLLDSKADINAKDNDGRTPLYFAALLGRLDVAAFLIRDKADVNAKTNNGDTPLHEAAFKGDKDMVELLLANHADANARDNNGETPLHAAAKGRRNVTEVVMADGTKGGHKGVTEVLVAHGADVNATDKEGDSPLRLATKRRDKEVAELLRQLGAHE